MGSVIKNDVRSFCLLINEIVSKWQREIRNILIKTSVTFVIESLSFISKKKFFRMSKISFIYLFKQGKVLFYRCHPKVLNHNKSKIEYVDRKKKLLLTTKINSVHNYASTSMPPSEFWLLFDSNSNGNVFVKRKKNI